MEAPMIYSTIAEVMTKINAISKGRKNQAQGFAFRGIDDVMNELHPVMAECGLFVVPTVLHEERTEGKTSRGGSMFYTRLTIKFTFYAKDGSSVESVVIGEAMDSGDKASNKALSIGLKYAMLQVFCIPTEDDKDPDAESHEFQAKQQRQDFDSMSPAAQQERRNWQQQRQQKPPVPNMQKASNLAPQPAGGPDTPEQHKRIVELLRATDDEGVPLLISGESEMIGSMRMEKTADQVIAFLQNLVNQELQNRREHAQQHTQTQQEEQPAIF